MLLGEGRGTHAALQLFAREFGEPAFDLIDPGGGRREVDMPVRSARQPSPDRRSLVAVVPGGCGNPDQPG